MIEKSLEATSAEVAGLIPPLFQGLCDDASMFPPGLAAPPAAVDDHMAYRGAWFQELVGPLVVSAAALSDLPPLPDSHGGIGLTVTLPRGPAELPAVLGAGLPLRALEIALPDGLDISDLLADLDGVQVPTFVEVPRDSRSDRVLAALAGGPHRAKFRTGGVEADMHPGSTELASVMHAAVSRGVAFKATAGLHHAVRNTDPQSGFEQHGFLNLLVAADVAADGGTVCDLVAVLTERNRQTVADWVRALDPARARKWFASFGTCSIHDPVTELVDLALLVPPAAPTLDQGAMP